MSNITIIPTFESTNEEDFEVLIDVIDHRLNIICHKPTGYFNITKIAKLVYNIKLEDNKNTNKSIKEKQTREWFRYDDNLLLIEECKKLENVDKVHYELAYGTQKKYAGTYVNELLYHQFMQWLDKCYALKVSYLLKQYREDITKKLIANKNAEINKLSDVVMEQRELLDALYEQFDAQSLNYDSCDDMMSDEE